MGDTREISENEKQFRNYLKKFHPDKYTQLITMENEEIQALIFTPT
jgi:hypothetical protein